MGKGKRWDIGKEVDGQESDLKAVWHAEDEEPARVVTGQGQKCTPDTRTPPFEYKREHLSTREIVRCA